MKAATAKGIIVMNTPFGNSITTAEQRALPDDGARPADPRGRSLHASRQMGEVEVLRVELSAKTLGVIGCGNIGSIVADRAIGLKMKVLAYDPFLSPERAVALGVEKVELDELLRRADFITLHTPLTDKTRNIIDAAALKKAKTGVRIVNCARGGLVDERAIAQALKAGQVAGAPSTSSRSSPPRTVPCSACPTSSARRIWARPRPRRRRTSPCRSPSRWPTTCSRAPSPMP